MGSFISKVVVSSIKLTKHIRKDVKTDIRLDGDAARIFIVLVFCIVFRLVRYKPVFHRPPPLPTAVERVLLVAKGRKGGEQVPPIYSHTLICFNNISSIVRYCTLF